MRRRLRHKIEHPRADRETRAASSGAATSSAAAKTSHTSQNMTQPPPPRAHGGGEYNTRGRGKDGGGQGPLLSIRVLGSNEDVHILRSMYVD